MPTRNQPDRMQFAFSATANPATSEFSDITLTLSDVVDNELADRLLNILLHGCDAAIPDECVTAFSLIDLPELPTTPLHVTAFGSFALSLGEVFDVQVDTLAGTTDREDRATVHQYD